MGLAETLALIAQVLAYAILAASLSWFASYFRKYCRSSLSFYLLAVSSAALFLSSLLLLAHYVSSFPLPLSRLHLEAFLLAAQAATAASVLLYAYGVTIPKQHARR
ncbi:MAG: hypothetical protein QXG98_00935 [Candidatus Micrarchaeia archaeon]